nr:hypothetical protein [Diplodia mutila fusagravirus 1]
MSYIMFPTEVSASTSNTLEARRSASGAATTLARGPFDSPATMSLKLGTALGLKLRAAVVALACVTVFLSFATVATGYLASALFLPFLSVNSPSLCLALFLLYLLISRLSREGGEGGCALVKPLVPIISGTFRCAYLGDPLNLPLHDSCSRQLALQLEGLPDCVATRVRWGGFVAPDRWLAHPAFSFVAPSATVYYAPARPFSAPHVSSVKFPHARRVLLSSIRSLPAFAYANFGTTAPDDDSSRRDAALRANAEVAAPRYAELGGAQRVPTQYAFATKSANFSDYWHPAVFPTQLTRQRASLEPPPVPCAGDGQNPTTVCFTRPSMFYRHFPTAARALVEQFSSSPNVVALSSQVAELTVQETTALRQSKEGSRSLQPRYAALAGLFAGDVSPAATSALNAVLGSGRFADTRGNRLVAGWEADAHARLLRFQAAARVDELGQSYLRVLYVLWARYFVAMMQSCCRAEFPDTPELSQPAHVREPLPEGSIVNLSAVAAPVANAPNPEAALWTGNSLDRLVDGSAVLLDVEGLPEETILELVNAFLPQRNSDRWGIDLGGDTVLYSPLGRATVHGATRIFLHWGNETPRLTEDSIRGVTPDDPDVRARAPSTQHSLDAIFHLLQRHHCGSESAEAFELALRRCLAFRYADSPVAADNAPNAPVSPLGTNDLALPRDFTFPAYFDRFRTPLPVPEFAYACTSLQPSELYWNAFILALGSSAALNWATFAFSLTGEFWQAAAAQPAAGANQFVRNHVRQFTTRLIRDDPTPWATIFANTTALMYGIGVRPATRRLAMTRVDPFWRRFASPFFTLPYYEMWALKLLPAHQMLPLPSTVPLWDDAEPAPAASLLDFAGQVRLARDLPRFSGRSWVQDGGMEFSLQHYLSTGTGRNGGVYYRCQGSTARRHVQMNIWTSPFQHELPSAPNTYDVSWLGAPGTPWADFCVPGSNRTFNLPQNRLRALGVSDNWADEAQQARSFTRLSWFNLTRKVPLQGLAVTYIHPLPAVVETDERNDYSMLELVSGDTGAFVGLAMVSRDADPMSFSNNYLPQPTDTWHPGLPAPANLPGHLANHNEPGQPLPRVTPLRDFNVEPQRPGRPSRQPVAGSEKALPLGSFLAKRRIAKHATRSAQATKAALPAHQAADPPMEYIPARLSSPSPGPLEASVHAEGPPPPQKSHREQPPTFSWLSADQRPASRRDNSRRQRFSVTQPTGPLRVNPRPPPTPVPPARAFSPPPAPRQAQPPAGDQPGYSASFQSTNPASQSELPALPPRKVEAGPDGYRVLQSRAPTNDLMADGWFDDEEVDYEAVQNAYRDVPTSSAPRAEVRTSRGNVQAPILAQPRASAPPPSAPPALPSDSQAQRAQNTLIDLSALPRDRADALGQADIANLARNIIRAQPEN